MRRFDKKAMSSVAKANLLAEQRHIASRSLISEGNNSDSNEITEMFGFGGKSIEDLASVYVPQLKKLQSVMGRYKGGSIDMDMINDGVSVLKGMNDVMTTILNDKDVEKTFGKSKIGNDSRSRLEILQKIYRNVMEDRSGRNRPDGLYLGDTHGLNTLKAHKFVNSDDEVRKIIGQQLEYWLNGNINDAIKMFEEPEGQSVDEELGGFEEGMMDTIKSKFSKQPGAEGEGQGRTISYEDWWSGNVQGELTVKDKVDFQGQQFSVANSAGEIQQDDYQSTGEVPRIENGVLITPNKMWGQ